MDRILLIASILFAIALAQPNCPRVRDLGQFGDDREFSFCITPRRETEGEVHLDRLFSRTEFYTDVKVHVQDCYEVSVIFNLLGNLDLPGGISKRDPAVIALLQEMDAGVFCTPIRDAEDLYTFDPRRQVISFPRDSCDAGSLEIIKETLGSTIFQIIKLFVGVGWIDIGDRTQENLDDITMKQVNSVLDFLAGCVRVYQVRLPRTEGCRPAISSFVIPSSAHAINFEVEQCVNGNDKSFNIDNVINKIGNNLEGFVNAIAGEDIDAGPAIDAFLEDLIIDGQESTSSTTGSTTTTGAYEASTTTTGVYDASTTTTGVYDASTTTTGVVMDGAPYTSTSSSSSSSSDVEASTSTSTSTSASGGYSRFFELDGSELVLKF